MPRDFANMVIIKNTLTPRTLKFFDITKSKGKVNLEAKKRVAIQLLNNIVNGSPNESTIPPIKTGRLRASGSVFVGNQFVMDSSNEPSQAQPTPSKQGGESNFDVITVGFNTDYAAKLHERKFKPGYYSQQSGNVGWKFVEKHLKKDKKELMQLFSDLLKEGLSKA